MAQGSVSTPRSSNWTGGFPASSFRTRRFTRSPTNPPTIVGRILRFGVQRRLRLLNLIGVNRLTPISRLSVASCVDLEPRPLPSTGVTRRRRYYGPLRHPTRPGLSLAGVRLSSRDSPLGVSRVPVDLLFPTCRRHYPGGPPGRIAHGTAYSNRFPARWRLRPSPSYCKVGAHIGLFEACSTFTHVTACRVAAPPCGTLSRRLRRLRYLHRRFDSYWPERPICQAGFAPAEDPRLFTAHSSYVPILCPRPRFRASSARWMRILSFIDDACSGGTGAKEQKKGISKCY